jgi:ribosomal protein L11 methyltransferase
MKAVEIGVRTTTQGAEIVADILAGFTSGGIVIKDKNDIEALQREKRDTWDYIDDALLAACEGDVLVSGFTVGGKAKAAVLRLAERLNGLKGIPEIDFGPLSIKTQPADDKAWHKVWKKNFRPVKIGDIVVCPKWQKYRPIENEKVIVLHSGMAFGTGEHETTAMCVELMQGFDFSGRTVIDAGCGSGILGLAAFRLGAARCVLTDIDGMALEAARQNIKLNRAAGRVSVENRSLTDGIGVKADFILANLTAGLLIELSKNIREAAADSAVVIASGIIAGKTDEVIDAFAAAGFSLIQKRVKNDWAALSFHKRNQ